MDESEKHIDELVATRKRKQDELLQIGQQIASLATPKVVAFIDLAESTQLKQDRKPEEWLGYIFEYIECIDQLARDANGTVIKRIGDEVMATFNDVQASECFVKSLISDTVLQKYRYKIALDYGKVYHFQFKKGLAGDPYGPVVDRCARIAKLASPNTVICTFEYHNQLINPTDYLSMGPFSLDGFPEPEQLFTMSVVKVESEDFLTPLVSKLNNISQHDQGYRFINRKFTPEFLRSSGKGDVRPFIARELLNVPKLPYSPKQFDEILRSTCNREEKERKFLGYFIEWEGKVSSFKPNDYGIRISLEINEGSLFSQYTTLILLLPLTYLEIVEALGKGQRLRPRGIIYDIYIGIIYLNYVDFETIKESD